MLSDGSDEFLGREILAVILIASMGHGRPVKELATILDIGDPSASLRTSHLFGEGGS